MLQQNLAEVQKPVEVFAPTQKLVGDRKLVGCQKLVGVGILPPRNNEGPTMQGNAKLGDWRRDYTRQMQQNGMDWDEGSSQTFDSEVSSEMTDPATPTYRNMLMVRGEDDPPLQKAVE